VPHLLTIRKGWENESLAAYLLSRFSFVARPNSVADDVGSDFFCTAFEIQQVSGRDALMPRKSFAIQVKSGPSEISVDNKIDYLIGLELPLFLGVVSQNPPAMSIYSAEFLPLLFSEAGKPDRLSLIPVASSDFDPTSYFERVGDKHIRLRCPHVLDLSVDDDLSVLKAQTETLLGICKRVQGNIAARVSEEHIYNVDGAGNLRIMAGSGSVQFFRKNFLNRLGEAFYNLQWILNNRPHDFSLPEFRVYESIYEQIAKIYGTLPFYISAPYQFLKAKLDGQEA
jgi:hypothetical protein